VTKTLAELKAENAALEQDQVEEAPQAEELENEPVEAAEAAPEEPEESAESEESEEAETEVEAWMQTEDEVEQKFTGSDIAAAKRKVRAKLEKKHTSEVDELRAEIESLKSGPGPQPLNTTKPKREDFFEADDPEEAYTDALLDWKMANTAKANQEKSNVEANKRKLQEQQNHINTRVDEHYDRAAQLTKSNGISEEIYQQADRNVRMTVESVVPNGGDAITDALISKIGEGSEKVTYYLGRNKAKLAEFEKALRNDPSGIEAAMLLGEVKQNLTAPLKRKSNAPAPAPKLNGDESTTEKAGSLLRKYKEAHKNNDGQKAFKIKREARKAGVNTREWHR